MSYPSKPRKIIVRLDHPSYALTFYDKWEREILLSLFHGVGNLLGKENEDETESYTIEQLNKINTLIFEN